MKLQLNFGDHCGDFTYVGDPVCIGEHSSKKLSFKCRCGRIKLARVAYVTAGRIRTCGKCNIYSAEWWTGRLFGKLTMEPPNEMHLASNKKVEWACDCGRMVEARVCHVTSGAIKTCGRCNLKSAEWWKSQKFGKLRMKHPQDMHIASNRKTIWMCDCGKEKIAQTHSVISGKVKTCGKCNLKSAEWWESQKFGRLRMRFPQDMFPNSKKVIEWICDCGLSKHIRVHSVTNGNTASCGNCRSVVQEWYEKNIEEIKSLKGKGLILPLGGMIQLEPIENTKKPFAAKCPICGTVYRPRLESIKQGVSLTCGCSYGVISKPNADILKFIQELGLHAISEYDVDGKKYDVCVPSKKLLIELNGLAWHSKPGSKSRDMAKYVNAKKHGFSMIMIFEDEWEHKRAIMQDILRSRLSAHTPSVKIRAAKCEIRRITCSEADALYNMYHYIGACLSKINYGIFYNEVLIGAVSFKHPSRQTCKHQHELSRMVMNPEFRVHGIWSKITKVFMSSHQSSSIVTYSDDRLFDGRTYESMGFGYDGNVASDYYWVKAGRRFHKSALRKPTGCNLTESQLRISQGYSKIWDLGKKRWVLEMKHG